MKTFTQLVLRHRVLSVIFAATLLVALCAKISSLRFESSLDAFFMKDDPELTSYNRFKEAFNSDEYVLIVAEAPAVWNGEFVASLRKLGDRLRKLPAVMEVTSIANARHIFGRDQELVVEDFLPEEASDQDVLAKRRTEAVAHPYYRDFLVTRDGRHVSLLLRTEVRGGAVDYKMQLTNSIRAIIGEPQYAKWNMRAVGAPILDSDVQNIVSRESALFGGAVFLLVGAGLLFVFRSALGLLLPLLIAICSIAAAFGVMTWRGSPMGILSPIIPSFMISVGIGTAVYLLTQIYLELARGRAMTDAVVEAMRSSGTASVLSVITTAGGLLAFSTSKIRAVEDVGISMGIGLLVSLVLTLVLVPVVSSLFERERQSAARDRLLNERVLLMQRLADFVVARRRTIALVASGVGVLAVAGSLRLKSDYHYLGNFKASTAIRQDYEAVDRVLHGSNAIEVLVDTKQTDGVKEPHVLQMLAALQQRVEAEHRDLGIKSYSVVDVVKEINQALEGGNPAEYDIPPTRRAVAETLLLFSFSGSDELTKLVTSDYRTARVTFRLENVPNSRNAAVFASIERHARELGATVARANAGPAPEVSITGLVKMWNTIHGYLRSSQLSALVITTLIVTVTMIIVLRSLPLGVVLALLNAFAVLITIGIMGWLGITLEPFTILISSIALGLLDDDTIHLARHLQDSVKAGAALREAIREAFASFGIAMFSMAAVLLSAFAVYSFSSIAGLTKFGLLTALTILVGAAVELLVTPAVLMLLEPVLFKRPLPLKSGMPAEPRAA